jgi:hypothetical protein
VKYEQSLGRLVSPCGDGISIPKWKQRLVNLPPGDTRGANGLCLDPHDMAVSKYIAGPEKYLELLEGLVHLGMLEKDMLLERLRETSTGDARRAAAKARIERQFSRVKRSR